MGDLTEHFSRKEFKCNCGCGMANIGLGFVKMLEAARRLYGQSISITSGCRCESYNTSVGGKKHSGHLATETKPSCAADIACPTSTDRYNLLMAILTVGFSRVGIGENFVHVDTEINNPQDVCWMYPAENGKW